MVRARRQHRHQSIHLAIILALIFAIFASLSALSVPARAFSSNPDVVISQVYGGGGNSGATLRNDFIELFNRGTTTVSLTGWSVQYASSTGSSWQRTDLTGVLQPGQYYLIQQAQGAGGSVDLPTPDAIGAIPMSATAGKVALVRTSTTIASGVVCPSGDANVVDFVGYGSGTNCFEGSAPAPGLSNTTAALRAGSACTDTNNNGADFSAGAPNPRNTAASLGSCSVTTPTNTPTPAPGPTIRPIGEVQGSVSDSADGLAFRSPFAPPSGGSAGSTAVTVQGVIFQRTLARSSAGAILNGFFLQNTVATADSDPNTSDGIFVFLGSATTISLRSGGNYTPQPGDEIVLSGRISEFFNLTQFSAGLVVEQVVRSGVNLDGEVIAFVANPPDNLGDANRYWERREGMRAQISAGSTVVGRRDVFASTLDAEVWVINPNHPVAQRANPYERRVFRDAHPLDNNAASLFDDNNGYRILMGSLGVKATAGDSTMLLAPARTFDTLTNAPSGGVYFSFNKYQIQVTEQPALQAGVDPALNASPQAFNRFREFSAGPYNIENLYDFRDDPFDGCDFAGNSGCPGVSPPFDYVPASDADYQRKLQLLASQIITDLHSPDIILVQEAEDQDICAVAGGALDCGGGNPSNNRDGKPDTLQELTLTIARNGGPTYDAVYDRNGADARGIVSAFLYRTDRVELVPPDAGNPVLGSSPTVSYRAAGLSYNSDVQNPKALNALLPGDVDTSTGTDGSNVFTRAPQVGLFRVYSSSVGMGEPITLYAIANHFSSGPDRRVGQRREQAAYNAAIVAALQAADAQARVLVGGDMNVYPRPDDPFPSVPSDQLGPLYNQGLTNLFDTLVLEEPAAAYGYVFQGQTQTLDQVFVTPLLFSSLVQVREAHINSDWPADFDGDGPRGLSDHDPQVARFLLDTTPPATTAAASGETKPLCPGDCFFGSARVTLTASDSQSGVAITQYSVNGGAAQTYSGPFDITSEGSNTVTFFSTDRAGNVEPTQSISVKVTTFPTTAILDDFNRADGRVGGNWIGATQADQYRIADQQVDVGQGGAMTWRRSSFGASQEAFMTLTTIDPNSPHHSLALKVRGSGGSQGAILVSYEAITQHVVVEALVVGQGWRKVASFPLALSNGDTLGARSLADGSVRVYVNCLFIGEADTKSVAGNTYVNSGGRIGVWFQEASNATFDAFGGGDVK